MCVAVETGIEIFVSLNYEFQYFSPNSCGTSWQKTAMAVDRPPRTPVEKAAPMANPSPKLCIESPRVTTIAIEVIPEQNKQY